MTPSDFMWLNKQGSVQLGNKTSDKNLYAQQHLRKTLRTAQNLMPTELPRLRVRPWFAVWTILGTFSYLSGWGMIVSSLLDNWVTGVHGVRFVNVDALNGFLLGQFFAGFDPDTITDGVFYGLLGGALLWRVDSWRRENSGEADELFDKLMLIGFSPVAVISRALARYDSTLGERSVYVVKESCPAAVKAYLQILGSLGTCAWLHGVLQQYLALEWTRSWDSSIEGSLAALLVTVAVEFTGYLIVQRILLPTANAEAQSCEEAVSLASERCERLFAYDAPAEIASLRAKAFKEVAKEWQDEQRELERSRVLTNFVRILTAATAYAASGENILAPLLTNVAVSDSLFSVLRGKPWAKEMR